jgi:hypothetical protein
LFPIRNEVLVDPDIIEAFKEIAAQITEQQGTAAIYQVVPQKMLSTSSLKICAVWFVRGINHGISIEWSLVNKHYEIDAWSHDGLINSVILRIAFPTDIRDLLAMSTQLIGLLNTHKSS